MDRSFLSHKSDKTIHYNERKGKYEKEKFL